MKKLMLWIVVFACLTGSTLLAQTPAAVKPMAPDADPSFEVATIKPANPNAQWGGPNPHRIELRNTSLSTLITFAYRLNSNQILGAPAWVDTERFDLSGVPDTEGQPNINQVRRMLQKLLADRFKLTTHHDKKELSVYALTAGKTAPKLTKDEGDSSGIPNLMLRDLNTLTVHNANMQDFTGFLQESVLDRPVVDQTALPGRYDFTLKWTPDDSQFIRLGVRPPPPADSADAPPGLFTAIQEQLGLKLAPTKASANVLVIDHVEKPSEN
jgi:uncharacterized protein (TIGR03435 family)